MSHDSLEAFEALYYDLESLRDLDRLSAALEAHLPSFRVLLLHKGKSAESRKQLQTEPKLSIDDTIYEINDDFRNSTLQLADELDVDELQCAKLLLEAQTDAEELDRSPVVSAIMRFHRRRQYLLECLRVALFASIEGGDLAADEPLDDAEDLAQQALDSHRSRIQSLLGHFTNLVLHQNASPAASTDLYWDMCLTTLQELEGGLQKVADRMQRAGILGQALSNDEEQIMDFERETLNIQHETLSCILTFLISHGRASSPKCLRQIINRMKKLDKHDLIMLHYLPIAMACAAHFSSAISSSTQVEIQALHQAMTDQSDMDKWTLHNLCRAVKSWWIVEYYGRSDDDIADQAAYLERDTKLLLDCLRDGGLQFMLSVAQDVRRSDWHGPAKLQLTAFLLKGTSVLPQEIAKATPHFSDLLMDHYQSFVDAFISNMPDALRQLKFDEDDQRKILRSRYQNNTAEYSYDLDRFLTIIAYAYQDSPESAKSFWADNDSNLYGFLQWSARRQTTPRAAAFCEMLKSLSEGEQCAESAHAFLLEEGPPATGKLRRNTSLSWNQIFSELDYYANHSKDRQALSVTQIEPQFESGQPVEPESAIMLECYLRLTAHLCAGSPKIRNWLLTLDSPSLSQLLFQLVSTSNDGRVRSWCLMTLASLLATKTTATSNTMWERLDQWVMTGLSASTATGRAPIANINARLDRSILDVLASGFEESNAFVHVMNSLLAPVTGETASDAQLPFPENLGSPHRLPGISLYVDFVLGKVFAENTVKLTDNHHLKLVRLNCLDFICVVLSTFNEDLVIIANAPTENHDIVPSPTSLETYVTLHPYARVMEWLHEETCLDALFAAATQDVQAVNHALSDSPLVLSLVRAIEVMNLLVSKQPMYHDVVQPFKSQRESSERPVSRSIIPTFEDAVLKHLDFVVNLGLYCGLGHAELTLAALTLLEKLSSANKLSAPMERSNRDQKPRNKLIAVLQKDDEVLRISRALGSALAIDTRELEAGPMASGFNIKAAILSFLKNALKTNLEQLNVAYILLGFSCTTSCMIIEDVDGFKSGQCLFYHVARLAIEYPDYDGQTHLSWGSSIKQVSSDILRMLWSAPLSKALVTSQLRDSDYGFLQAMRQKPITSQTLWAGYTIEDPLFIVSDAAFSLCNVLKQRTAFFDYFARELRSAKSSASDTYLHRLQASLLGSTILPGSSAISNPNVFDLFDFMELDLASIRPIFPTSEHFSLAQFEICITEQTEYGPIYNPTRAQEIIALRKKTFSPLRPTDVILKDSLKGDDLLHSSFDDAASEALISLVALNQWRQLMTAHQQTLKMWSRLLAVMMQDCEFDGNVKAAFMQQAYQVLVPKFEKSLSESTSTAVELANLILVLVNTSTISSQAEIGANLSFDRSPQKASAQINAKAKQGSALHDAEHPVFRAALGAISNPAATLGLRELCYEICFRYLRKILVNAHPRSLPWRNVSRSVKQISDRMLETICDDSCVSQYRGGIGALLLLDSFASIINVDGSKFLVDGLDRLNFVVVLVDSIRQIPENLRLASPAEIKTLLDHHIACLLLMLRLAQTRIGAASLTRAGLMSAVKESGIFSADPDVGLAMDNSEALANFFDLMLAVLRVVNSVVIQQQSEQILTAARNFITDNRTTIIGILKRSAAIGGLEVHKGIDLADLVDNFTVLLSATAYLMTEELSSKHKLAQAAIFT